MSRYPRPGEKDWPMRYELEHLTHAYAFGFDDEEVRQIIDGACTVWAMRLQSDILTAWGSAYRSCFPRQENV